MSDRALKANTITKPARIAKAVSLREQIYENLRERIHTGQLTLDERLVDVEIANEFGVSRMPVREALMQLVHDGMIESTSRGFVLRRYSDREIEEIFEIRRLLEPAAAAIAAKKMTEHALAKKWTARSMPGSRRAKPMTSPRSSWRTRHFAGPGWRRCRTRSWLRRWRAISIMCRSSAW